jgi:hypothetical protein
MEADEEPRERLNRHALEQHPNGVSEIGNSHSAAFCVNALSRRQVLATIWSELLATRP